MTRGRPGGVSPLPPYAVRVSPRAKHVRLTVSAEDGLVVVLPRGVPASRIPGILEARREWIARALDRLAGKRQAFLADEPLPDRVEMPGVGASWLVVLEPCPGAPRLREREGVVTVTGDTSDKAACEDLLRRWARKAAAPYLKSLLEEVAAEHGMEPRPVTVRAQKQRWGSHSMKSGISLNFALAFLPPELARHVILHELNHYPWFDHSPRFWAELEKRDPETPRKREGLKDAWRHLPGWVLRAR